MGKFPLTVIMFFQVTTFQTGEMREFEDMWHLFYIQNQDFLSPVLFFFTYIITGEGCVLFLVHTVMAS